MKKVFVILCVCAVISACGGSAGSSSTDSAATASTATATSAAVTIDPNAPGAKLMAAADCYTCHKADVKIIGPAFKDVAEKYPATPANIDTLANKVIKGGKGHWGDVPMAAHPNLSLADAKTIVTYVLSLKK